jgi:toxin CptA
MKSALAITFDYRPSRSMQAAVVAVALLASLAVFASGIAAWAKALFVPLVLAYAAFVLYRLRRPAIRRCAWHADGQWRVRDSSGNDFAATLRHASVRAWLIVLQLQVPPSRRPVTLVLLPDNCDAATRRCLRVRLARGESFGAANPR